MHTLWIALAVFSVGYLLNVFYITVLYHRGLTHQSVLLVPAMVKWVGWTGIWVTGIDPKAWACMHRLHHQYSDTEKDPHSPQIYGVFGVALEQLRSYELTLRNLISRKTEYLKVVADIPFNVSFLNRKKLWLMPYILHLVLGVLIGFCSHSIWIGGAYYVGIVSHPVQGWMVNSLAHKYGYRNFATRDRSTNNWFVSLLVFGEGYQNNHHARPRRANFAIRGTEIDFGYALCLMARNLGLLKLRTTENLAPERKN
jgi:stearoyl-CoA desaturase (delta-9 desaturase)